MERSFEMQYRYDPGLFGNRVKGETHQPSCLYCSLVAASMSLRSNCLSAIMSLGAKKVTEGLSIYMVGVLAAKGKTLGV